MEQQPSDHDQEALPPQPAPSSRPAIGEGAPPNEPDMEPAVPPAFDPATTRPDDKP